MDRGAQRLSAFGAEAVDGRTADLPSPGAGERWLSEASPAASQTPVDRPATIVPVLPAVAAARALGVLLAAQQLGLGFDGRVQVTAPTPVVAGASGELSLTILDTPAAVASLSVRLRSTGVSLPEARLGDADVVDPQASQPRVRARFVAPPLAGRYEVEGLVEYVTCVAERCRPRRARVQWMVEVLDATPAPS